MLKSLTVILLLALSASFCFAYDVILIDSECVMLEDIFPDIGIKEEVYCGLDYGEEKTINRQMATYIINKYNIAGAKPGEVTFRRKGTLLTEDRLREDLSQVLSVMYTDMDVEMSDIRMTRDFYYSPSKGYDIDVPEDRFGNVAVKVDNGNRTYSYTVYMKAFKEIYVSTGSIRKDQEIKPHVAKERYDLSKVYGEIIKDPEGFIATRNIPANRPVTTNMVMKKPDAFAGTSVMIVYSSGQLNVTTTGELLDDAYTGKIVRVQNTASGKIIRGKYTADRKVLVNAQ